MNKNLIERAFERFSPKWYKPTEPQRTKMDYSNPAICPYCKAAMELSKIRKANGEEEAVYLCRTDRAVGCVPDTDPVQS